MATSKPSRGGAGSPADDSASSLAQTVGQQMPGWKLVPTAEGLDAISGSDDSALTHQGAGVDALRAKYLGRRSAAPPSRADAKPRVEVKVFKVQPASGGPAQVAELRDGKVRIVSG
jgi:hypothetical protein